MVRGLGGEGIEGLGDEDDPPPQGDVFSRQAIWVSLTIEPLVVVADKRCGLPQEVHLPDDSLPQLGVLTDHIELLIGQLPRLSQNLLADHDLPHIVEQRAEFKRSQGFRRKSHRSADGARVIDYPPRMPRDDAIPAIDGINQCFDGIDIVSIELVVLVQKLLSGEIAFLGGKFLQIRYLKTVVTPRGLVGCELPRVDVVLDGLRRHPEEIGCLFRGDLVVYFINCVTYTHRQMMFPVFDPRAKVPQLLNLGNSVLHIA